MPESVGPTKPLYKENGEFYLNVQIPMGKRSIINHIKEKFVQKWGVLNIFDSMKATDKHQIVVTNNTYTGNSSVHQQVLL